MPRNEDRPIPSFLMDSPSAVPTVTDATEVVHPTLGTYPTEAQMSKYPKASLDIIADLYKQKSEELNQSVTREADLRDALAHAVVAMESAQQTSVMMARGEQDAYDRTPSHVGIQNVLELSLFHIRETTGITARGVA